MIWKWAIYYLNIFLIAPMTRAIGSVTIDSTLVISDRNSVFSNSVLMTNASNPMEGDVSHAVQQLKMQMLYRRLVSAVRWLEMLHRNRCWRPSNWRHRFVDQYWQFGYQKYYFNNNRWQSGHWSHYSNCWFQWFSH